MIKDKVDVELNQFELIRLIQLLVADLADKAHSGLDTIDLPETRLNVKLLNAKAEMFGEKPLSVR